MQSKANKFFGTITKKLFYSLRINPPWHNFRKMCASPKISLSYIFSILLLIVATAGKPTTMDDLIAAFHKGDASGVSEFFDETVEITFPYKTSTYSRNQAGLVLRSFFSANHVNGFTVQRTESNYCIGRLLTERGSFRTSIFAKQLSTGTILHELRFEK